MKKIFLSILLASSLILGCDVTDDTPSETGTIAVYIVDYTSNEFERGGTISVEKVSSSLTQLPISSTINQPANGLKGGVSLVLTATGDQVFNGELSEEGNSAIFAPLLLSPSSFFQLDAPIDYPSQLNINEIEGPYNIPFQTVWEAIDDLSLTKVLLDGGAFFGRYLYQSSPDVSSEWKWVVIIYNP